MGRSLKKGPYVHPKLLKKVERRGGLAVEVTDRERRWPLLFLWPKVFRVLRSVRGKHSGTTPGGEEASV